MANNLKKLGVNDLKLSIANKKIDDLKKIKRKSNIIGQERAVSAIKMGLGIQNQGFNIFVMGASGTGRRTALKELLKDFKPNVNELYDIAYRYNFNASLEPKALFFPAGQGNKFKTELKKTITEIVKASAQFIKSERFLTNQKKIIAENNGFENSLIAEFEMKIIANGFKLIQSSDPNNPSIDLVPLINGELVEFNDLQIAVAQNKFSKDALSKIRKNYFKYLEEMTNIFETIHIKREETEKKLDELLKTSITPIIQKNLTTLIDLSKKFSKNYSTEKIAEKYSGEIFEFLKEVENDLIGRITFFTKPFKNANQKKNFLSRYFINLICEHTKSKNYVITENLPNFANLFGTIEGEGSGNETMFSNVHLRICPGAIHKAFGGYLILRLQDLLQEEESWFYLKRVLQSGKIEIQAPPSLNNPTSVFKPQQLNAQFKLILIGGEASYDILYQQDPDFYKLFKVCAEFDSTMDLNDANMAALISLTNHLSVHLKGLPFANSGYARLIAYSSELANSRKLLSTKFTKISDLISEANFIAKNKNAKKIDSNILEETINYKKYLHSLLEEKFAESIKSKETILAVDGMKIGNINGLAVFDRGYYSFGMPTIISAQASPGQDGIINIETESGLSGEIYDKAHLIISSLLRKKYNQNIPLSVDATICFEQSYNLVEGDSASCAEFYSLISAIGQIPLRQDIAITGSLNQHGEVQAVGGVSEKVEGFFNACQMLGFTGTQGVIIPESNKDNLFLPTKILDAIKNKAFSIWTIKTIDDGIELLSNMKLDDFNKLIETKLVKFNEIVKEQIVRYK